MVALPLISSSVIRPGWAELVVLEDEDESASCDRVRLLIFC